MRNFDAKKNNQSMHASLTRFPLMFVGQLERNERDERIKEHVGVVMVGMCTFYATAAHLTHNIFSNDSGRVARVARVARAARAVRVERVRERERAEKAERAVRAVRPRASKAARAARPARAVREGKGM